MNNETRATVTVAGREVAVSETDGEKMRLALIDYASRAPDAELQKEAARLTKATPRVEDGQLRIGSWLFEARDSGLVLARTLSDTPAALVLQLAYVEGEPGGGWRVTRHGEEVFHFE